MKNEIVTMIRANLFEIMPELSAETVSGDDTFIDLGANSIDRGELISLTLERLSLETPRIEFVGARTINELANMIEERM